MVSVSEQLYLVSLAHLRLPSVALLQFLPEITLILVVVWVSAATPAFARRLRRRPHVQHRSHIDFCCIKAVPVYSKSFPTALSTSTLLRVSGVIA